MNDPIRLQLYLARCGLGSRRKCEELISCGLIEVNGVIVNQMGSKITPDDVVKYRGEICVPEKKKIYLIVNKPPRYLCANFDPQNRPLVQDLFKNQIKERLFHVGRLDYMSQGLIFYTNDGQWANQIAHPSREIEKEYLVNTRSMMNKKSLDEALKGIIIENELYRIKSYSLEEEKTVRITLVEGKNREIRRLFKHWNWAINFLKRIRIGRITDMDLETGKFRFLSADEVLEMKK